MIADLRPYPATKDSGVPWLGDVPEHWRIERLKSSVGNVIEQAPDRRSNDLYVALENVESWTGRLREAGPEVAFDSQVKRFRAGDVLFGKLRPYLAKVTRPTSGGVCVGEFLVLRAQASETSAPYLEHLLRSKPIIDAVNASTFGAKMPRADWRFVGSMAVTLPPLPEQAAIVRFLDHADRRIRRYIRAKQELIKLLEEQKQAIIHRAVTRGLDPGVRLKPSGVEWLGDVPEHWEVVRLKSLVSRVTSGSRGWSNFAADSGALFIRIGNLTRTSLDLDLEGSVRLQLPAHVLGEATRTRVQPDDILLSITASIGSVAVVPPDIEEAYVSQHVACCRPRAGSSSPRWVGYVLLSSVGQTHGQLSMYGGTKQGLSLDDVGNYVVLLPPRDEQDRLVGWIERSTASLNAVVRKTKHDIALLREYHTRLIADVVTGKLDVRVAAARLPDEAEEPEPFDEAELERDAEESDAGDGDGVPEESAA